MGMTTKKENAVSYLFGKLWEHSHGRRDKVTAYAGMFIMGNIIKLVFGPLVWAHVVNLIQQEGVTWENFPRITFWLCVALLPKLAFWVFHGPARLMERANAFLVRADYRKHLVKGVLVLGLDWHTDHHSGDTIDKVEKGTNALISFCAESFEMIAPIARIVICAVMLGGYSPEALLIVAPMVALSCWITIRFDKLLMPQYALLNRAENGVAESVYDAISNVTTVIILRVEQLVFDAISDKIDEPFELYQRNSRLNELKWFLISVVCEVMTVLVIIVYLFKNLWLGQAILIGNLYLLTQYLNEISELFFHFTGKYSTVVKQESQVRNAEEIARDFKPENFTNHVLPKGWKMIEVKGLSFAYGTKADSPLQLDGVSFSFRKGEKIALVGKSGSGKTTVLKVIRDLYHPRSLELRVDGKRIDDGFPGISRAISLIPQNPEIFATTILDNITLGARYAHDTVMRDVRMARFEEVLTDLPNGLATSVKERGVNLSGGQQQRLALVRGFLASAEKDIVLLDEPTSSLDAENEDLIYRAAFEAFADKTIISSIHRLHLLHLFDRIFFFEGGRLTCGTLDELLETSPAFKALWDKQHKKRKS